MYQPKVMLPDFRFLLPSPKTAAFSGTGAALYTVSFLSLSHLTDIFCPLFSYSKDDTPAASDCVDKLQYLFKFHDHSSS